MGKESFHLKNTKYLMLTIKRLYELPKLLPVTLDIILYWLKIRKVGRILEVIDVNVRKLTT